MIFGASYDSGAIVPDGTPPPEVANPVTDYHPGGRPGGRAPHAWLERDGTRLSTIDLLGDGFVLLAGEDGAIWRDAAVAAAGAAGVPLKAFVVGPRGDLEDPDKDWATLYGVSAGGAVLIRPDGHVGWRGNDAVADPRRALATVLARVLSRVS